jgi:hypothetical protein
MAFTVLPPPTTFPVKSTDVRLFNAVIGSETKSGHTYGAGFQSPGMRTKPSPRSNGPASITRTLTIACQASFQCIIVGNGVTYQPGLRSIGRPV